MAGLVSPSGGVPADMPHRFIYPATSCWAGLRVQSLVRRVSARKVAFWLETDTTLRAGTPPTYPAAGRGSGREGGPRPQGLLSRTLTRRGRTAKPLFPPPLFSPPRKSHSINHARFPPSKDPRTGRIG